MDRDEQQIEIITREAEDYSRSRGDRLELVSEKLNISVLRDRFKSFIASLQSMIDIDKPKDLPFELDEVQFSAEISANGEFKLIGTGVGVEASSAVTFVLKRKAE
jgi:hypothetical protein